MQTMEMGSAEAAMNQIPAIVPPSSSSYFLQLDPSGHIDILESSLVLNKPEIPEETVYEIQLDHPFVMDERNVEINLQNLQFQNLQNFQGTLAFQPELVENHQLHQHQTHQFVESQLIHQQQSHQIVETPQIYQHQGHQFVESYQSHQSQSHQIVETPQIYQHQGHQFVESHQSHQSQDQQTYATTLTYEPQQIQFQIDDASFNQMLLANNNATVIQAPTIEPATAPMYTLVKQEDIAPPPPPIKEAVDAVVPEYVTEFEVTQELSESEEKSENSSLETDVPCDKENESFETDKEIEDISISDTETPYEEPEVVIKREIRVLPDKIMNFSEEAVIPPLVEISPTPAEKPMSPLPPNVVDLSYEEEEIMDVDGNVMVPSFLHEGIDPDDELYISYLSRPDSSKTVLCILCYEWFKEKSDLEDHLISVHQDNMKLYGCKRCGQQFWSRFLRQRHEKTHRYDLKGPMHTNLPKNKLSDQSEANHYLKRLRPAPLTQEYKDHLKILHSQIKSMEYECFECGQEFGTEEEFREHNEENHAIQTCVYCRKTFENAKQLRHHESSVHGKIALPNQYPGGAWKLWEKWDCKELTEPEERIVDLYLHHNYSKKQKNELIEDSKSCDTFGPLSCEDITMSKKEASKLKKKRKSSDKASHKKSFAGEKEKWQEEPVFKLKNKKSKSKSSKTKKTNFAKLNGGDEIDGISKTGMELPFKCLQCRTSYTTEIELQRHLKTHTIRSMAYMCQYCGRGFATHSNRKEHERIHTGDKPYVCPICSRAFVQISNLKKHIQTHKDKNNLQCTQCQKQFVKESSLILHQRAHSQDRKFRCHVCDRAYNYASLLKRHMRIHTGENPYSCEDCGMMFHELVSLHYHRKKVHTGERPHRCEHCGRAFILSSDLKKHLKIHDRDGTCAKAATKTYSRSSKHGKIVEDDGGGSAAAVPRLNSEANTNGTHLSGSSDDHSSIDAQDFKADIGDEAEADAVSVSNAPLTMLESTQINNSNHLISETNLLNVSKDEIKAEEETIKNETNNVVHDITANHLRTDANISSNTSVNQFILS